MNFILVFQGHVFLLQAGKRSVTQNTVFYMPHCGKALYNNLLWKNWSKERLKKLVIIGNSFDNMKLRLG